MTPPAHMSELTTREAAGFLGLSVRTFWRVAAPHLRPRRYSLRSIRWQLGELEAYRAHVTDPSTVLAQEVTRRTRTGGMADLLRRHGCIG